jgi:hypothetical protein
MDGKKGREEWMGMDEKGKKKNGRKERGIEKK